MIYISDTLMLAHRYIESQTSDPCGFDHPSGGAVEGAETAPPGMRALAESSKRGAAVPAFAASAGEESGVEPMRCRVEGHQDHLLDTSDLGLPDGLDRDLGRQLRRVSED